MRYGKGHRELAALYGSLFVLTTIALSLRFTARRVQKARFLADDWVALAGYCFFLGAIILATWGISHRALGYSLPEDASEEKLFEINKQVAILFIIVQMLSVGTWGCIKISALLFYRRVFCVPQGTQYFKMWIMFWVTIISLWTVAFFILPPVTCGSHFQGNWDMKYMKYCNMDATAYGCKAQNISDLMLEFLVLLSPIPVIWNLHTSLGRRLSIMFVFLTAFVGVGATATRIYINYHMIFNSHESMLQGEMEFIETIGFFYDALESGLGLIAINLPTLFFLRKVASPSKVVRSLRDSMSWSSRSKSMRSDPSDGSNLVSTDQSDSFKGPDPEGDWRCEVHALPVLTQAEEDLMARSASKDISVFKSVEQRYNRSEV